jgi:hypothetical protein
MMTDKQQTEQTAISKSENANLGPKTKESKAQQLYPDYLGPFPVALGENAETYKSLLSTVAAYYKPSDPIEWIHVRDIADGEWQKQRMRRAIATCIDVAQADAIQRVLKSRRDDLALSARQYAEDYVNGSNEDRSVVLEFLREQGLTEETFTFTAVSLRAAEIERMERSAMGHQACRDEAIRALARHHADKTALHRPALPVEDAEYRTIEDNSENKKEAA